MNQFWMATIGTSVLAFLIKYSGTLIPSRVLESDSVRKINALLPIAMLSALVAVQAFAIKKELLIDHRAVGLLVAAIALRLKAGFPVVVGSAALVSALIVRLT
ncbi:MAG: AzlD domain-containing protein [Candidatus Nanopelagicaceae bacterium]